MNLREEVAAFLGPRNFEPTKFIWTMDSERDALFVEHKTAEAFQKSKESLYMYTWREEHHWWRPHLTLVGDVVRPPASVLDYHSSTGWMGLRYSPALEVSFADYQTRCTDFLRWRLKDRGLESTVYDVEDDIPVHDAVVCFDAAWRYRNPWTLVQRLAGLGAVVVMDLDNRTVDAKGVLEKMQRNYTVFNHRVSNHYVDLVAFRTGIVKE